MLLPRTLGSQWYRDEIFYEALRSIEGMGQWNRLNIDDQECRVAYSDVIEWCVTTYRRSYDLSSAIEKMYEIREELRREARQRIVFLYRRRIEEIRKYKMLAVEQCIELLEGIRNRYLVH